MASHFVRRRSAGESARSEQGRQFIADYQPRCEVWLEEWCQQNLQRNTPEVARQSLKHLQFSDGLSLWFCCGAETQPHRVATVDGPELTLTPTAEHCVHVTPWPWRVPALAVAVSGRLVAQKRYRDRDALAAAPWEPVTYRWQLVPSS
jgi:hypothetical protein